MLHWKKTIVATATLALLGGSMATAAQADPDPATPLDICVQEALDRAVDSWTCVGGTMTYPEAQAEESADFSEATELSEDGWVTEVVTPDIVVTEEASRDAARGNGDDWDLWCENGTICHRKVSAYISETKGDAAYGDLNGAIGNFDMILRTNLNGRQPRYTMGMNTDTGPNLSVTAAINCVQDKAIDTNCGSFPIAPILIGNYRSNQINGNRLDNNGTYFSRLEGKYTPVGYGTHNLPRLQSQSFKCSGTSCKF